MKVDVVLIPWLLDSRSVEGEVVVVIDVLRATTTIATALGYGAKSVVPLGTVEEVVEIAKRCAGENILTCGERGGIRIPGFDKGNSPLEYVDESSSPEIKGKTLLFTTTNGSQVFKKVENGSVVMAAGFVNASRVTDYLADLQKDCLVVCSGIEGRFSLEDTVCAGMIVNHLRSCVGKDSFSMNDDALASAALYDYFASDLTGMLRSSENGKNLVRIGLEKDLSFCAEKDRFDLIPVLEDGCLVRL